MAELTVDFDDFLSPDAVVTDAGDSSATLPTLLTSTPPQGEIDAMLQPGADLRTPEQKQADAEAEAAGKALLADLDEELLGGDETSDEPSPASASRGGRPKTDKSGLLEVGKKLLELELITDFEEEEDDKGQKKPNKPLEEYSTQEWIDLFKSNIEHRSQVAREEPVQELIASLPKELQYALDYAQKGGQDLKGLFKALATTQDIQTLDPANPDDQESIVRAYLHASGQEPEDIEELIEQYKDSKTLGKWAEKHKPRLDALSQQQVELKLAQQTQAQQAAKLRREQFQKATFEALKTGQVAGAKVDAKTQEKLYQDLTQLSHQSLTGRATTKLNYNLERLQFGDEPNMALIAEVNWLLDDPEGYKKHIAQGAVRDTTLQTARQLKQAQNNKNASAGSDQSGGDDNHREPARKAGAPRPARNIFGK